MPEKDPSSPPRPLSWTPFASTTRLELLAAPSIRSITRRLAPAAAPLGTSLDQLELARAVGTSLDPPGSRPSSRTTRDLARSVVATLNQLQQSPPRSSGWSSPPSPEQSRPRSSSRSTRDLARAVATTHQQLEHSPVATRHHAPAVATTLHQASPPSAVSHPLSPPAPWPALAGRRTQKGRSRRSRRREDCACKGGSPNRSRLEGVAEHNTTQPHYCSHEWPPSSLTLILPGRRPAQPCLVQLVPGPLLPSAPLSVIPTSFGSIKTDFVLRISPTSATWKPEASQLRRIRTDPASLGGQHSAQQ
jgi:hypothetical protein